MKYNKPARWTLVVGGILNAISFAFLASQGKVTDQNWFLLAVGMAGMVWALGFQEEQSK